ncbi:hypothetical protein G6F32_017221 [Rhizopus arrhizus]|nr:hypothetical protein G6F32_017221 [Rhizopus arrhizus]
MRSGRPWCSASQGCSASSTRRCDTVKPVRPALGLEPRPVAPSSRISPPAPVEAPGNGAIAVGWLCVSTFIKVCTVVSRRMYLAPSAPSPVTPGTPAWKRCAGPPSMMAALSE